MPSNATDQEIAALLAQQGDDEVPIPKTRRSMKNARMNFKDIRMKLRRDEKKAKGLTRGMIDHGR